MLPDRVSNPGPLTYESGALPIEKAGLKLNLVSTISHQRCWLRFSYGENNSPYRFKHILIHADCIKKN